jgi:hypothetical protein
MPNPLKTERPSKVVERVGVLLLWSANLILGMSRGRRYLDRRRHPSLPQGANGSAPGSGLDAATRCRTSDICQRFDGDLEGANPIALDSSFF